jgi:hypothetical protein
MTIEKLRKRKNENIISGIRTKVRVSLFFRPPPFFSFSLSFLSDRKPYSPHYY